MNENTFSPIDKTILYAVGIYLIIVFILCIVLNSTLLLVFIRHRDLRAPINLLIITMTVFNLMGSVQFPFVIDANFKQRYIKSLKFKTKNKILSLLIQKVDIIKNWLCI